MANEIGLSQIPGAIPDIVRVTALMARYAASTILPRLFNAEGDVQKKGDRVSVTILGALSVNNVGAGGSVTRQQVASTSQEIVLNSYKEATVDIDDLVGYQSPTDFAMAYGEAMGEALAEQQETDSLAEHTNITGTTAVGSTAAPVPLDDSMVRLARLRLDRKKVPKKDRFYALHVDAEADLIALARFSEAQSTGFGKGLQVEGGLIKGLYGIPVEATPLVASTGTPAVLKNLLLHEECVGVATQRNFRIVKLAKVQLSEAMTGVILYGVKTLRNDHGVVINSAPNAG